MVVTEALARGLPVDRGRGRRRAGGPRPRRRRHPARAARAAGRPGRARRRAAGLARRRRAATAAAPGRARAARVAPAMVGRPRRSSPASCRERRDDRRGDPRQHRAGSTCASPPTPPPGPASSSSSSGGIFRRPARWVIHDLACGTGAMGRWLAPLLPGPQHWVLHDRDADLLEVAAADLPGPAADGAPVAVETQAGPTSPGSTPDDLAGASLITASALLDLLTERRAGRAGRASAPESGARCC